MPPKKKGKKGKKEPEQKAEDIPEELRDLSAPQLRERIEVFQFRLHKTEKERNYMQLEKDMVNRFYEITREEVKQISAELLNKDRMMEMMERDHRVHLKVHEQKVQNLEYEHKNARTAVQGEGEVGLTQELEGHTETLRDMQGEKVKYRQELSEQQLAKNEEVRMMQDGWTRNLHKLREDFDHNHRELQREYEKQVEDLIADLELRRAVEIHEIEERKNQHINDLMKAHEAAFQEMKEYYNDITRENLELIRTHRVRLTEIGEQIEQNLLHAEELKKMREDFDKPKREIEEKLNTLQRQLQTYGKDMMGLRNAKARLQVLIQKQKQVKQNRAELEEKFIRVEKEKNDMYMKFEVAVEQLRSKANVKNQVLDQVLAVRQAELERKNVQLRELVQRSGLDQDTVDEICKKMEEAIEAKNSIIRNLRYSMAHATKAYNDAIRVYEAKLVEFGIPAEELGLELLETQTSDMPAGLVAA